MGALLEAALRMQVPVFPCGADKAPMVGTGFKAATRDTAKIHEWFNGYAAMIGVPTGSASGIVVIDVDCHGEANGMPWWHENQSRMPATRRHRTKSGGLHLVFLAPSETIKNSASRIARGVDVRGEGGYVIVPPSPGYSVEVSSPIAVMPEWLIRAAQPQQPKRVEVATSYVPRETEAWRQLMRAVVKIGQAKEGQRNVTLNSQAYYVASMVGQGLGQEEALSALYRAAQQAGLADPEIKATLHSAFSAGMGR